MAMLKTYIHHNGNTAELDRYVFRDGRSLAHDCSIDLMSMEPGGEFGRAMNQWRRECRKDRDRTAYHFVLSPDPKNRASLDQVRVLATTWAGAHFSDAQWFIGYHNDGNTGEIHAHIVVNAVGIDGKKIRINEEEWAELGNSAMRMAAEVGMQSALRGVGRKRKADAAVVQQDNFRRMAEIKMDDRGAWSWKEDIRKTALTALKDCPDFEQFALRLKDQGYRVAITKRGLTYYHPLYKEGSHQYCVKDVKLGAAFTREGLVDRFTSDLSSVFSGGKAPVERYRLALSNEQRERYIPRLDLSKDSKPNLMRNLYRRSVARGVSDTQKLADALKVLHAHELTSASAIRARIDELERTFADIDQRWAEISVQVEAAEQVSAKAAPIEWYSDLIAEYERMPFWKRGKFEHENAQEIKDYYNAREWCEANGLDPDAAVSSANEKLDQERKNLRAVRGELEAIRSEAVEIYDAIKVAIKATAAREFRKLAGSALENNVKRYSIEDIEIVRSFHMNPHFRVPTSHIVKPPEQMTPEQRSRINYEAASKFEDAAAENLGMQGRSSAKKYDELKLIESRGVSQVATERSHVAQRGALGQNAPQQTTRIERGSRAPRRDSAAGGHKR